MGLYTDLLANAKSWDSGNSDGVVATDRVITTEIKAFRTRQGDPTAGSAFTTANEVQTIAQFPAPTSSGNFTVTVDLYGEAAFTTANIAWNANAAAIEGAIDTAATAASVTGWTNGDIDVALTTNLNGGDATLTFNGTSVKFKNHGQTTTANVDLDAALGVPATTTHGQHARVCWAAMDAMGLVTGGPPPVGTTTGLTATTTRLSNPYYPRQETLEALAMQATIEDSTDAVYTYLMGLFGQSHTL